MEFVQIKRSGLIGPRVALNAIIKMLEAPDNKMMVEHDNLW